MKIRYKNVDGPKLIWRINENICGTFLRDQVSIGALGGLQYADYGRPHGHDPAGAVDSDCGGR